MYQEKRKAMKTSYASNCKTWLLYSFHYILITPHARFSYKIFHIHSSLPTFTLISTFISAISFAQNICLLDLRETERENTNPSTHTLRGQQRRTPLPHPYSSTSFIYFCFNINPKACFTICVLGWKNHPLLDVYIFPSITFYLRNFNFLISTFIGWPVPINYISNSLFACWADFLYKDTAFFNW